jgi:hypothetical protein
MKITELKIAPVRIYSAVSVDNPMRCTVKIENENTAVETVLSDEQMFSVLSLVQSIVADAAQANVEKFCALAQQIDTSANDLMIEQSGDA